MPFYSYIIYGKTWFVQRGTQVGVAHKEKTCIFTDQIEDNVIFFWLGMYTEKNNVILPILPIR